jgi:hypothetical protein
LNRFPGAAGSLPAVIAAMIRRIRAEGKAGRAFGSFRTVNRGECFRLFFAPMRD